MVSLQSAPIINIQESRALICKETLRDIQPSVCRIFGIHAAPRVGENEAFICCQFIKPFPIYKYPAAFF